MSDCENQSFDPADFKGTVRLFPLPNLVLFPHVLQPLHIFEPRYRALLEAAMCDDRLIAMALLAPGWEKDYEGHPPVRSFACLGRVAAHQRLDDGRYNLLLQGVRRVELIAELPAAHLFREARAELREDVYPLSSTQARPELGRRLVQRFKKLLPKLPEAHDQLDQLLSTEISLGMLTDLVAYALDLGIELKQRLLSETDVDARAHLLLERLEKAATEPLQRAGRDTDFPPEFSLN